MVAAVVVTASFQRRGAVADASQRSAGQVFTNQLVANQSGSTNNVRTLTNEVIVPVTATDGKGRYIEDLVQSVSTSSTKPGTEDRFFSHEQSQPVVIGFLIDRATV